MENQQRSWEDWATETFVGSNYYYYKTKWKNQTPDRSFSSWSWDTFFFPFFWLAYRKMYLYSFLFFIVSIPALIIPFAGIILHCLIGFYANYLYFKRCNKMIQKASQYDNEEARLYLLKHGGISPLGLIFSILFVICLLGVILGGIISIGANSYTSATPTVTDYEVTSTNKEIIVTAPIDYKQDTDSKYDLYLSDDSNNFELVFDIFSKENYTDSVNEQYFMDLMVETFKSSYTMQPVTDKELLILDHQAPQALYTSTSGISVSYLYFTCEKFDQYYVLTIFSISPSEWNSKKDEIADAISSVRPNDTL